MSMFNLAEKIAKPLPVKTAITPEKFDFRIPSMNMDYEIVEIPHKNLAVPDTWDNVREFAHWWMQAGTPIMIEKGAEVFLSDDATASCLFRKGRFQVEMYLIHPQPTLPSHQHPGVEVIKMRLGSPNFDGICFSNVLREGEAHGSNMKMEAETTGYPLVAFQHWLTRDPTTIASMWKGTTAGPRHEAIIRRFNPDAYIKDGYADITRKQS